MELGIHVLAGLLVVMAFATYFQTVTGFGLSIIVIGVTSGLDLVPLSIAASVVSLVSLSNCAMAVSPAQLPRIPWHYVCLILLGAIPASILGVVFLEYLSRDATSLLEFLLGLVITVSGIQSALRPTPFTYPSSGSRLTFNGIVAGLSGGLFGMPGPPIVFLMYRQPLDLNIIRQILLIVFLFISLFRMIYLAMVEGFDTTSYLAALFSLPLIAFMTKVGKRFPPTMSQESIRRGTFSVLVTIGIALMAVSGFSLFQM